MILSQLTTNKNVLRNVICLLALFVWCASCASFAICEVRRGHPPKIIARSPPIPLATKVLNFLDPNLRFLLYTCEDYLEGLAVKKAVWCLWLVLLPSMAFSAERRVGAYYCTVKFAGGIAYNNTMLQWEGTI